MDFQGHELLLLSKSVLPTMAKNSSKWLIFEITMTNFEKIDIPSFPERLFQSKIRQSWQHWSKLQGQSSWVKVLMQSNLLLGLDLVNKYWKINYGQGSWHQRKRSIFLLLKMNSLKIETIKAAAASERR